MISWRFNSPLALNLTKCTCRGCSGGAEQLNLFEDYVEGQKKKAAEKAADKREKRIQNTILAIQNRYGKNAVVKGMNLLDGATTIERNQLIGGHKADE